MAGYQLKVSPRMLELLSKDLYSNIYFVLAELIANAYDADAENVYIFFDETEIRVEDDGKGMSSSDVQNQYLLIGGESRTCNENAKTQGKKRLKMGRKGVGKLAALTISNGFQLVTVHDNSSVGIFIPHRIENDNEQLRELSMDEYVLKKIKYHGTAVIMKNPKIKIPKKAETIHRNLAKIFPNNIEDFKIHIIYKGVEKILIHNEENVIKNLVTFISVGSEKEDLRKHLSHDEKNLQFQSLNSIEDNVTLLDNNGELRELKLNIYGWIGTYKTSREMKKEITEFSDNYLAIFAHNKMGLRNVLPIVGKNRVYESYIVGNLYIDAFEDSDFPDMAGTNRQGYNESDARWECAVTHIRKLTDEAVKLHNKYIKLEKIEKDQKKEIDKEKKEIELKEKLEEVTKSITGNISDCIINKNREEVKKTVARAVEIAKPILGLKATVDANKKKIMISHTYKDKYIADIIYNMLLFNRVPKEDIIYSSGSDPETNLPETDIYDYLRKFFVNSVSDEKIYVLFITSKNVLDLKPEEPKASWGELMEIGATWVTKRDHWIFNVDEFRPEAPLNTGDKWVNIKTKEEDGIVKVFLSESMVNSFCNKIILTCEACGYNYKEFEKNKNYLMENFITVED